MLFEFYLFNHYLELVLDAAFIAVSIFAILALIHSLRSKFWWLVAYFALPLVILIILAFGLSTEIVSLYFIGLLLVWFITTPFFFWYSFMKKFNVDRNNHLFGQMAIISSILGVITMLLIYFTYSPQIR